MPFSQSPACGREVQRARTRARVDWVEERSYWKTASLMTEERRRWTIGMSISFRVCQSWCEAEAALGRAGIAEARREEGSGVWLSIRPTNLLELLLEATKAAWECSEAWWRLMPPRLLGNEAFCQDHSIVGPPKIDSKVSLRAATKFLAACWMWSDGQVLRT